VTSSQNAVAEPADGNAAIGGRFFTTDPRQLIKIVVYSLLAINFFQYLANDFNIASHTVHAGWGLGDWARTFATSIDESAWFVLLFLLELETYLLSDEAFTRGRVLLMQSMRFVCYVLIGHTVFAFSDTLLDLSRAVTLADTALCSLADTGLSFARNLTYSELTASNCQSLSSDTVFYQFAQNQVVTDRAGLQVEWELAWVDLLEVVVWLFILMMIEVILRLQEKGVTSGALLNTARMLRAVLYGLLWLAAAYWIYRGHWMFAWDEALWILGFIAIGMNLSQWRKEIDAERAS
jgi:hypothetical protein